MSAISAAPVGDLVLDEQAIDAFVKEIVTAVPNVALAYINDQRRTVLWERAYQCGAPDSAECVSNSKDPTVEPEKRALGGGNFAFDFPLQCANIRHCVFTLVIYTLDPPSLMSVSYQTSQMLSCIARQLDVDSTLGTATIATQDIAIFAPPKLAQTETPLQDFVQRCSGEHDARCIAIVDSSNSVIAFSGQDDFRPERIIEIAGKLREPLTRKRRIVTARVTLPGGAEGTAVCAPILGNARALEGVVVLLADSSNADHTKVVRLLANKASKERQSQPRQSQVFDRLQLVAKIDDTLQRQPTLTHSLIYFDTDKTHTINDAFGYSGGDRALATFRRILIDSSGANDAVAHLGGDRFALFLPGASGDTAFAKGQQVLQFLAQESIDDNAKSINLSASAGVVDTDAASKGAEDMMVLSEVGSRGAQERGGNQCALFQDIDSSIIQRRSDVDKVGFLQMALIENRFVLHAQRIAAINADAGQKFELLARLDDENGTGSSPAQFLSAAERYQLMAALDRWVINSALTSIAAAENTLETSLSVFCINVSAQSLRDDAFVDFIEARIAETGVPPDTLCFEITETSLVRHIDRAQKFVYRLQRLGCLVALDDFGTGYSSFAYLKNLPVNFLKIDGSFVRDLLENELSQTIVKAVVSIADVIGAQTVAEHVENELVQAWLKEAGVHFVQGFVIHRPAPLDGVLAELDGLQAYDNHTGSIDLRDGRFLTASNEI